MDNVSRTSDVMFEHDDLLPVDMLIQRACVSFELAHAELIKAVEELHTASSILIEHTPRHDRKRVAVQNTQAPSVKKALATTPKHAVRIVQQTPRTSSKFKKPLTSHHFAAGTSQSKAVFSALEEEIPVNLPFTLRPKIFGLVQERIRDSLYALVVQAILWNKPRDPRLDLSYGHCLSRYPTPSALANASVEEVEAIIQTLGLQRRRAQTLVKMATVWVSFPPCSQRRYIRRDYPRKGANRGLKERQLLDPDDVQEGWEIGHLPGVGEYALDSYRIFGRDSLRGLDETLMEDPEWKRVVPRDKELAPYVQWKWAQEGWLYDPVLGSRTKIEG